jgi:chromosome segregation ATPase
LETYIAKHDEQWQTTVNGIKNEYNKLKGVACQNENELALVRAYRAGVKAEISAVETEKEKLRGTLVETQTNLDNLKTIIKNAVGE